MLHYSVLEPKCDYFHYFHVTKECFQEKNIPASARSIMELVEIVLLWRIEISSCSEEEVPMNGSFQRSDPQRPKRLLATAGTIHV